MLGLMRNHELRVDELDPYTEILREAARLQPEDADRVGQLTAELQRELAPSHPLTQVTWSLVAESVARDDVLLVLEDATVAITHLTYTSSGPEQPSWPMTTVLRSREELERQFLLRD